MTMHDTYESPLVGRNASREMLQLWSPQKKFGLWRQAMAGTGPLREGTGALAHQR